MKFKIMKMLSSFIRTFLVLVVMGLTWFFSLAMKTKKIADDLWQQLGITQFQAHQNINYSFTYGQFTYLGARNAKNIAAGDRVAMITDLVAYAKKYTSGEEFRAAYESFRNRNKPAEPVTPNISADSIRAVEKERIEKAIKQAEANANSTNEKLRNSVPLRLENLKKELNDLNDPDNKTIKLRMDNARRTYDYALKLYKDAMQKFEAEYPQDPQQLMKRRLQKILDITTDVDYNAELKDAGRVKVFVNPAYESKPKEWKLAYRAGKASTDAVRKFAQDWLKQLN